MLQKKKIKINTNHHYFQDKIRVYKTPTSNVLSDNKIIQQRIKKKKNTEKKEIFHNNIIYIFFFVPCYSSSFCSSS
jgi:hypothetical protein